MPLRLRRICESSSGSRTIYAAAGPRGGGSQKSADLNFQKIRWTGLPPECGAFEPSSSGCELKVRTNRGIIARRRARGEFRDRPRTLTSSSSAPVQRLCQITTHCFSISGITGVQEGSFADA